MRWIVVIVLAVVVVLTVYTVWPIYDLYRIASAVEDKSVVRSESLAIGIGWAQTLSLERLLDLLGKGSVSTDPSLRSGLAAPFAASSFGSPWQVWLNSDYSGRTFYVTVPVDRPSEQRFRIRLRLVHWDWKLLALDLPESTKTHLVEEFAKGDGRSTK